jgi:hypothetical protein
MPITSRMTKVSVRRGFTPLILFSKPAWSKANYFGSEQVSELSVARLEHSHEWGLSLGKKTSWPRKASPEMGNGRIDPSELDQRFETN